MRQEDRDRLIRVDERTNNIWRVVEALNKHQSEQNGFIKEALIASARNTAWRKAMVTIFSLTIGAVITKLQGLW